MNDKTMSVEDARKIIAEAIKTKPVFVELVGIDGNAFNVMGAIVRACRRKKWTAEEINAYDKVATSGDYNNLLAVSALIAYSDPDTADGRDGWWDEDDDDDDSYDDSYDEESNDD